MGESTKMIELDMQESDVEGCSRKFLYNGVNQCPMENGSKKGRVILQLPPGSGLCRCVGSQDIRRNIG